MKYLMLLLLVFGLSGALPAQTVDPCRADIDTSGTVDFRDFQLLVDAYGTSNCGLYWLGEDIRLIIRDTLIVRDTIVVRDTLVVRETVRDTVLVIEPEPPQPQPEPQPEPPQPQLIASPDTMVVVPYFDRPSHALVVVTAVGFAEDEDIVFGVVVDGAVVVTRDGAALSLWASGSGTVTVEASNNGGTIWTDSVTITFEYEEAPPQPEPPPEPQPVDQSCAAAVNALDLLFAQGEVTKDDLKSVADNWPESVLSRGLSRADGWIFYTIFVQQWGGLSTQDEKIAKAKEVFDCQ